MKMQNAERINDEMLMPESAKHAAYQNLVSLRKTCFKCKGVYNPSSIADGKYDRDHIGPWTEWQGNLNAELMVIGQDWGGHKYYEQNEGRDEDNNQTNVRLKNFLENIGFEIEMPSAVKRPGRLYFTNAMLCCREGLLTASAKNSTGPVKPVWFRNCAGFLRSQIELLHPKVIVTLGHVAYCSVVSYFGLRTEPTMKVAIQTAGVKLPGTRTIVVPVYHCGSNGRRSRDLGQQTEDWKRVKAALGW